MGGEIINKVTAKKNGAVQIVIVAIMCAVMVLLCCGTAWGLAFAERNKRTGEPVNGAGFSCGGIPDGGNDFLHENIITTTFGGCGSYHRSDGDPKGCADSMDNCRGSGGIYTGCSAPTTMYAALPLASIPAKCKGNLQNCARIQVINPVNNASVILAVVDTGPMNINDSDYVLGQAVPKAQQGIIDNPKNQEYARQTRPGLDISPEARKILGEGNLSWRFTDLALSDNSATGCASNINSVVLTGNSVMLDAGHNSGHNKYSKAISGIDNEGDHAWNIANKVKKILEGKGISVGMTKSSAVEDKSLPERVKFANMSNASMFLSIHSDSGGGSGPTGIVWCKHSGIIDGNNKVDYASFSSCQSKDNLVQSQNIAKNIAEKIQSSFHFNGRTKYIAGDLGVLEGLKMPGALIEMFFHDNNNDLNKADGKDDQMAQAIADGIMQSMGK